MFITSTLFKNSKSVQTLTSVVCRSASVKTFKAKDLVFHETNDLMTKPSSDHKYLFGQLLTDYMLEVDWTTHSGWTAPQIKKVQPFQIDPRNSTLHYALECFEGMKAYPHENGKDLNIFRGIDNMKRMNDSFKNLAFPAFDNQELLDCISQLIRIERAWLPK